VKLSRRNLLTLLAKLDGHPPNSACTIQGGSDAWGYFVVAEEDEEHYAHREGWPTATKWGPMISSTEDRIEEMRAPPSDA
jgi:homoserine kinase